VAERVREQVHEHLPDARGADVERRQISTGVNLGAARQD